MVIGAVGCGKTSLIAALKGEEMAYKKTQSIIFDDVTIDTPGEYMENPMMYKYLIATAQGIKYIIFAQDATKKRSIYPPGFAQSFTGKTIAIITKIDAEGADVEKSIKLLKFLGLKGPIFETSAKTGQGLSELKEYIKM